MSGLRILNACHHLLCRWLETLNWTFCRDTKLLPRSSQDCTLVRPVPRINEPATSWWTSGQQLTTKPTILVGGFKHFLFSLVFPNVCLVDPRLFFIGVVQPHWPPKSWLPRGCLITTKIHEPNQAGIHHQPNALINCGQSALNIIVGLWGKHLMAREYDYIWYIMVLIPLSI